MQFDFLDGLFVLMLATFIGLDVIRRVSRLLHTPLMSLTNAISAIAVVGAILLAGEQESRLSTVLGAIAVFASTTNIVSGFLITDRMLKMFKRREPARSTAQGRRNDRSAHPAGLPRRDRAVHLLAQMDERSGDRAARRVRRRRRHGARDHRHADASADHRLQLDRDSVRARRARRHSAVVGAADGRSAADRAVARVRRSGGRPRRHGEVLPVGRTRRADDVPHGRDRARGDSRLPDVHRQPGRRGQAAGGDSDAADHVSRAERHQLHAARGRSRHRGHADDRSQPHVSCSPR